MDPLVDFVVKSRRTLLPQGAAPRPASVRIRDGKIAQISAYDEAWSGVKTLDVGDQVLMPGLVDSHVHINEPGRTEWEGFQTATFAAAAGGITTVIDMPLNSIPATTELAALQIKAKSASGHCSVDYGFWGGVVPGNSRQLQPMIEAGALGFKAFLIDSGVPEFPMVTEADLRLAMPILAKAGIPLLVHAEVESPCAVEASDERAYQTYLQSRPGQWEVAAVRMMIRLSQDTGCPVHIVHLSAADALADLRSARAAGTKITVETCPHYLFFSAEQIPDGATQYKCAPPIREKENSDRLWRGLQEGIIDFIVSDHSPCLPKLKKMESGDFEAAWGGIPGLQFSLSVVWTEMRRRGLPIERLAQWMCQRPARLVGLSERKGEITVGRDADLVIWDPEKKFQLQTNSIRHRHKVTPYDGREFSGVVGKTFLRGQLIYSELASESVGQEKRVGMPVFAHGKGK